jgi:hypothetical protein
MKDEGGKRKSGKKYPQITQITQIKSWAVKLMLMSSFSDQQVAQTLNLTDVALNLCNLCNLWIFLTLTKSLIRTNHRT